jgi:hypothetical protein
MTESITRADGAAIELVARTLRAVEKLTALIEASATAPA